MFLPLNSFENICVCFLLLMIYSTIGWVAEMIYHSIVIGHMSEKRGFLNGFLCPIYGHGALLVLYVLHGGLKNPILTFLAGMVLTSALEYFTSWIMEALFHMRWWDYSNCKYQLNGRVCLTNTFFFGLGSVLLCHVVNPPIMAWLFRVGPAYTIPVASFISGLYLMDITLSVRSAIQLSNRLDKLHQLRQEVKDHLSQAAAQLQQDYYGENGGVVFPNPNAPTGILMPLSEIEDIIAHNRDVIVVVDEAYIDFGGESALPLIEKYDNLLVAQTFSKSRSLAGMRLGFAMGNEKLIRYINDVKYSFNSYTLNQTALVLGVQAIRDREYFEETCAKVIATREWTKCELKKLGFSFGDSMSNFIFATHERVPAKEIFEVLREHNIFVRYFSKPRISNYLRISIGTQQEMERLTAFLAVFLGE